MAAKKSQAAKKIERPGVSPLKKQEDRLAPFVKQALGCVRREYPRQMVHLVSSATEVELPKRLNPVFYGSYDWHSAVHTHWLLVRSLRSLERPKLRARVMHTIDRQLTRKRLKSEFRYVRERPQFEVPYGAAWVLTLAQELIDHPAARAGHWSRALRGLAAQMKKHLVEHVRELPAPIRGGEHLQTAFALGLALDYARASGDKKLVRFIQAHSLRFFGDDRRAALGLEPGPYDFVSPILAEADLMRRVLPRARFPRWLAAFLPGWPLGKEARLLKPGRALDPAHGKLVHTHGLNLSRAWMLEGIASALPTADRRRTPILKLAKQHSTEGLRHAVTPHYAGAHWLGSFAVYLITGRGL